MSNKELTKKLRCLRMHLLPLMTDEHLKTLEEAERRLENTGSVSTNPPPTSSQIKKKNNQGRRITKSLLKNTLLNSKGK